MLGPLSLPALLLSPKPSLLPAAAVCCCTSRRSWNLPLLGPRSLPALLLRPKPSLLPLPLLLLLHPLLLRPLRLLLLSAGDASNLGEKVEFIEGVGPVYAGKLNAAGIVYVADLLKRGATRQGAWSWWRPPH